MSEFVNTKDIIGNQNTLDSIVSRQVASFADEDITSVPNYAFRNFDLTSVNIPNVTVIKDYAFENCRELSNFTAPKLYHSNWYALRETDIHTIKFATPPSSHQTSLGSRFAEGWTAYVLDHTPGEKHSNINGEAYRYLYNCFHLILRMSKVYTIGTATSFCQYSPIAAGYGWIYVPDALVNTCKETTGYSAFADRIVGISQYPKAITGDTITDTWEQIFEAEEDGTYLTKYALGDTKFLTIRNQLVLMEIVAFDTDDLSDGSGKAKITWMTKGAHMYASYNRKSGSTLGGWPESEIRQHIIDRYFNPMDVTVRSNIKQVRKYSEYISPSGVQNKNLESSDYIWIPSWREMAGGTSYETAGPVYTEYFTTQASRKKYPNACVAADGTVYSYYSYQYMTRTITSATGSFLTVHTTGAMLASNMTSNVCVVFGFCT